MYDDLARTQNSPPLEWLVVHAVIPTVLVTFVLQAPHPVPTAWPLRTAWEYNMLVIEEPRIGRPAWMPHAVYPTGLVPERIEGYVRLKALVDTRGLVMRSSISILHATDARFVEPARTALAAARFRPTWFGGERIGYVVTMTIVFPVPASDYAIRMHSKG